MVEPVDPQKFIVLDNNQKKLVAAIIAVFIVIIFPALSLIYYNLAIGRPNQASKEITLEISKGDSVTQIAKELKASGAINSEFLFIVYMKTTPYGKGIQAGVYVIKPGTSTKDLALQLQNGRNDISIKFIEGWRSEEYARVASDAFPNIDMRKFQQLSKPKEGYLFPDTYTFNREITETDLINKLTDTFDLKTKDVLTKQALEKVGLTKDQVVIFASILEREVHKDSDRRIVAGILIKRWKEGMKLDVDATTQYAVALSRLCPTTEVCSPTEEEYKALNWWPNDLSAAELDSNSPYNTRKNVGLPPGPISNPGLAAIQAVLSYESSPYFYYLTDNDGVTHYAVTLEEHNVNAQKYLGSH